MSKFAKRFESQPSQPRTLAAAIKAHKQNGRAAVRRKPVATIPQPISTKQKAIVTSSVPVDRKASISANTTNKAGGKAFTMSDKMEFVTGVLASLLRSKNGVLRTYETEEARIKRLGALVAKFPEFAAKVLLSARIQHGLRSIVHALTPYVINAGRGSDWLADFVAQVFVRADDPSETAGAMWKQFPSTRKGQKHKLPNSFKKGFARYVARLDRYRIAKYGTKKLTPSLLDLVNMCHVTPNDKNRGALRDLMKGEIKQVDTWETELSNHQKNGKTKNQVWSELIRENKLGYLGLLRNLRNIATECTEYTVNLALTQLRDKQFIAKSGVLPMQFVTAYNVIRSSGVFMETQILAALDDAVETAAGNIPKVGDDVLIAIDTSGSMGNTEREAAAMFAACLLKANPRADIMFFASGAQYATVNRRLPLLELCRQIRGLFHNGATNFNAIFRTANKAYDSVVILSDAEGWVKDTVKDNSDSAGAPVLAFAEFKRKFHCDSTVFMFDLGGDGSLMFREDGIILLAGYSFQVFSLLKILKQDRTKLVDVIDEIVIGQPLPRHGEDEEEE